MPLPRPKPDETKDQFVSRCMSDEKVKEEFSDVEQRSAVCLNLWRKDGKT